MKSQRRLAGSAGTDVDATPKKVRATMEALSRGHQETADAANAFRTAGRFRTAALERRRQALEEVMEAWARLSEIASNCLQEGADCTKADRDAWDQQESQLRQAGERWSAIEE